MSEEKNILELRSVSKIYGSGRAQVNAVDGVDLQIARGEIVLIMGPSGSGKTTMLSMAGGLLAPTSGEVIVAGRPLGSLTPNGLSSLRLREVGFVFQAFNLLAGLSALENVAVVMNLAGRTGSSVERDSRTLLGRLGLEGRLDHVPADLSGGEKQRVALARALANNPPLILADEPTGNLDSHSGREVMMMLVDLAREENKAVVVVTHDNRIVDIADRVLWLEDGILHNERIVHHEKVTDPVCGMEMEMQDAVYTYNHGGRVYYFSSEECRHSFMEKPDKYS